MTKIQLQNFFADLRYFTLFPKRYDAPKGQSQEYWRNVTRSYGNMQKRIKWSYFRWYVITYDDGHKELAYIRVLCGGIFSGLSPALYRGIIIPRMIDYSTFARIKDIKIAF